LLQDIDINLDEVVISPELENSKQQAVDFSQVAGKLVEEPIEDEFEFDFFDVQSETAVESTATQSGNEPMVADNVAGDVVDVPAD
jgi:cell division septation protein DedD